MTTIKARTFSATLSDDLDNEFECEISFDYYMSIVIYVSVSIKGEPYILDENLEALVRDEIRRDFGRCEFEHDKIEKL